MENIPLENISLNIALLLAVTVLWRAYNELLKKLDGYHTRDSSDTSRAITELANAVKAQSDSITAIHNTVVSIIETKVTPLG